MAMDALSPGCQHRAISLMRAASLTAEASAGVAYGSFEPLDVGGTKTHPQEIARVFLGLRMRAMT